MQFQRPRADSGEYIIPESELEEISGELKEDPESKKLRAEFSDILEHLEKLEKKKRDHNVLAGHLEKERAVPADEQVPAIIKNLEKKLAANPPLTEEEAVKLEKLHARRLKIEATPGVIPRTGTARRRRHRKNLKRRKTAKRRHRTRKH
jgi:Asp-tRNA(Asn)/Glu-tRNA(Gln) amidotransferase C subunit